MDKKHTELHKSGQKVILVDRGIVTGEEQVTTGRTEGVCVCVLDIPRSPQEHDQKVSECVSVSSCPLHRV